MIKRKWKSFSKQQPDKIYSLICQTHLPLPLKGIGQIGSSQNPPSPCLYATTKPTKMSAFQKHLSQLIPFRSNAHNVLKTPDRILPIVPSRTKWHFRLPSFISRLEKVPETTSDFHKSPMPYKDNGLVQSYKPATQMPPDALQGLPLHKAHRRYLSTYPIRFYRIVSPRPKASPPGPSKANLGIWLRANPSSPSMGPVSGVGSSPKSSPILDLKSPRIPKPTNLSTPWLSIQNYRRINQCT